LHTGIEKTAEQKKWQQVIPLVERMDYLGPQSNSLAFCLSVETLLGIEVPQRVKDIRVLIAELQRLSSHLVWFGTHAMEIGAITGMLYAFREREILMNLNEHLAGFRFFPSYIRVGGLREDIPRGWLDAVTAFLDRFPGKLDEYETLITKNPIWLDRTRGVGTITLEDLLPGASTVPSRAAGGDFDVRRAFPLRLRDLRLRRHRRQQRRRLRPLHRARGRDARA
jgi:NADH-quinone oxidoreductase subunit D